MASVVAIEVVERDADNARGLRMPGMGPPPTCGGAEIIEDKDVEDSRPVHPVISGDDGAGEMGAKAFLAMSELSDDGDRGESDEAEDAPPSELQLLERVGEQQLLRLSTEALRLFQRLPDRYAIALAHPPPEGERLVQQQQQCGYDQAQFPTGDAMCRRLVVTQSRGGNALGAGVVENVCYTRRKARQCRLTSALRQACKRCRRQPCPHPRTRPRSARARDSHPLRQIPPNR